MFKNCAGTEYSLKLWGVCLKSVATLSPTHLSQNQRRTLDHQSLAKSGVKNIHTQILIECRKAPQAFENFLYYEQLPVAISISI